MELFPLGICWAVVVFHQLWVVILLSQVLEVVRARRSWWTPLSHLPMLSNSPFGFDKGTRVKTDQFMSQKELYLSTRKPSQRQCDKSWEQNREAGTFQTPFSPEVRHENSIHEWLPYTVLPTVIRKKTRAIEMFTAISQLWQLPTCLKSWTMQSTQD